MTSGSPPLQHRLERASRSRARAGPARAACSGCSPAAAWSIDGQTLATDTQLMLRLRAAGPRAGRRDAADPGGPRARSCSSTPRWSAATSRSARVRDLAGRRTCPGRLYVPTGDDGGADRRPPLLLFFHGGGWMYGDLDSHDAACRFLAERSGVRVLAVDYRLAPGAPVPRGVRRRARGVPLGGRERRATRRRPGRGSPSAATPPAATWPRPRRSRRREEGLPLAFQLLVYPGTDMRGGSESRALFADGFYLTERFMDLAERGLHSRPGAARRPARLARCYAEIPAGLAPAYVVTAGFDPLRDEGEAYARRLADAGVAGRAASASPTRSTGSSTWSARAAPPARRNAEIAAKVRAALGQVAGAVSRRAPAHPRPRISSANDGGAGEPDRRRCTSSSSISRRAAHCVQTVTCAVRDHGREQLGQRRGLGEARTPRPGPGTPNHAASPVSQSETVGAGSPTPSRRP